MLFSNVDVELFYVADVLSIADVVNIVLINIVAGVVDVVIVLDAIDIGLLCCQFNTCDHRCRRDRPPRGEGGSF